jgi:hypothetical protein
MDRCFVSARVRKTSFPLLIDVRPPSASHARSSLRALLFTSELPSSWPLASASGAPYWVAGSNSCSDPTLTGIFTLCQPSSLSHGNHLYSALVTRVDCVDRAGRIAVFEEYEDRCGIGSIVAGSVGIVTGLVLRRRWLLRSRGMFDSIRWKFTDIDCARTTGEYV